MSKRETGSQEYVWIPTPRPVPAGNCPSCGKERETEARLCESCTELRNSYAHTRTREGRK